MTVIYSTKTVRMPMAIIAGKIPNAHSLEETVRAFRRDGLPDPSEGTQGSGELTFVNASQHIKDYLVMSDCHTTPDHYFFSPRLESRPRLATSEVTQQTKDDEPFDSLFSEFSKKDSGINLIIDSVGESDGLIRKYVLLWSSVTNFEIRPDSEYHELNKFQQDSEKLFQMIETLYDDPLRTLLDRIEFQTGAYYRV